MVLFASIVLAVTAGKTWHWGLFVWGAAVGLFAIVMQEVTISVARRIAHERDTDGVDVDAKLRARRLTLIPSMAVFGLAAGIISASLPSAAVDLIFTVIVVVAMVLPIAFIPVLLRKQRARATRD